MHPMNAHELALNKNEDVNKMAWSDYRKMAKKIHLGGGEKSAAKQKAKGKLLGSRTRRLPKRCRRRLFGNRHIRRT